MLVLTWIVVGQVNPKTSLLPVYRLPGRFRPTEMWARVEDAQGNSFVTFDVNDDGVSIFDVEPSIAPGQQELRTRHFQTTGLAKMEKDSHITLDIDHGGGQNLTVHLYLEEV